MSLTVKVDADLCISAGNCVRAAPEAFAFDDEEVSAPQPGVAALSRQQLVQIARSCPVAAIRLYEPDGEKVNLFS